MKKFLMALMALIALVTLTVFAEDAAPSPDTEDLPTVADLAGFVLEA